MEKIPEYKIKPEKVRSETSLTILKGQPHELNAFGVHTRRGVNISEDARHLIDWPFTVLYNPSTVPRFLLPYLSQSSFLADHTGCGGKIVKYIWKMLLAAF
jgi:hypothetical protein